MTSNAPYRHPRGSSLLGLLRLIGAALLLFGTTVWVSAHAELVRSDPEANATLPAAPPQVTAYFSQPLDAAGSRLDVTGADGTPVSQGDSTILADDNKAMQVALQPDLAPGAYTVQWTTKSAEDGDEANGSFSFTVGAAEPAPPTTDTQAPGTPAQPATPDTQAQGAPAQPSGQLPTTSASPEPAPSLIVAACLLVIIAGCEIRRRARLAAEMEVYAHEMD